MPVYPVKGAKHRSATIALDISIPSKGFIIKRNKNYIVSSSRRFCKGDSQPNTCIGMLLERLR